LSVDPLSESTNSPYAYVWNDPVNFADPTGMMGERLGKPYDWGRKGNLWEWKSEITKKNYQDLGYDEIRELLDLNESSIDIHKITPQVFLKVNDKIINNISLEYLKGGAKVLYSI